MKCYFTIKGDEILIHVIPWVKLKNIILNERSQSVKSGFGLFHSYEMSRIDKYLETESRVVVAWEWGQ